MKKTLNDRFLERFEQTNGCWEWKSTMHHSGYGVIYKSPKQLLAHRVSWEYYNKTVIPDELEVDHICRNRKCVNPKHLRIVTHKINCLENSESPLAKHAKKTHCPKGHPLSGDNLVKYHLEKLNQRFCKACFNQWQRNNRKKKAERLQCSGL